MIKDPNSMYEGKRSKYLLKVKKFEDDEAIVIKVMNGTGKYHNVTGSIRVRREDGMEFKLGSGFNDT